MNPGPGLEPVKPFRVGGLYGILLRPVLDTCTGPPVIIADSVSLPLARPAPPCSNCPCLNPRGSPRLRRGRSMYVGVGVLNLSQPTESTNCPYAYATRVPTMGYRVSN